MEPLGPRRRLWPATGEVDEVLAKEWGRDHGGVGLDALALQVSGLPGVRVLEVPYLTYGSSQGPFIACGGGLFASVMADWTHCDSSQVGVPLPPGEMKGLALMSGTEYIALTDGKRNDLRDRVLVTVSPRFEDVLPSIPNPRSPNIERLAPYMVVMATHLQPNLWRTMKRYGMDHVITCDFARIFVQDFAEGFSGRWRPHPSLTIEQVKQYRQGVKDLGYLFGAYTDLRDWFPLNEFWDEREVSLTPAGEFVEGWYGNYLTKPSYLPDLARLVGERFREQYPADSVYMDTHTCTRPSASDYEAGAPGAGIARDQVIGNGECVLETGRLYGSTISEGAVRWMYAGIADMDYASLFMSRAESDAPPLVDFDLLKIHPLNLGTMMGYAPDVFFQRKPEALAQLYSDAGSGTAPQAFYQYVSASLAYGHMLMLGYGYLPPLSRMVHLYALMQGVQTRYLPDTVAEISYHDGQGFVSTSRALSEDSIRLGRVRVRYAGGTTVHVNYNREGNWTVGGYELPPYGWLITGGDSLLAFSALLDGRRVDYVRCPEYIYLNAGETAAKVEAIEASGAVWLKRDGAQWRLIPCGDLGPWQQYPAEGLPDFQRDMRLAAIPADRGVSRIVLDTQMLMGKAPADVTVEGHDDAGRPVACQAVTGDRLEITPSANVAGYLLR